MSTFSLSDEQEAALDEFRQGRNIMISGPAGTGKTFVIREMVAAQLSS
jgi:superfamily II DNA or RNA helicase